MREILFRAKRIDNGAWIEGYYIHLHKTTYCFAGSIERDAENEIHQIVFEQMTDWGLPNQHFRADIDPETLCEYTGLKDISGKKIFEGDILKDDAGNVWFVSYEAGAFGYSNAHCAGLLFDNVVHEAEIGTVVGNIFDNPELLN